ncbi:HAUS augmin-like complex subunit 8 [Stigmatopora nigra]
MASGKSTIPSNATKITITDPKGLKSRKTFHQPASKSNGVVSQSREIQATERASVSKRHNSIHFEVGTDLRNSVFGRPKGTAVQSRYMQAAERASISKNKTANNDSGSKAKTFLSPKPSTVKIKIGISPRYSTGTPAFAKSKQSHLNDTSLYGNLDLQSTISDGHSPRPDLDISNIEGKTVLKSAEEADSCPQDKMWLDMQALLLVFINAKAGHNTAKLKAKAEARLLHIMEIEEMVYNEMMEKKRKYLLMEKQRQANELLDLQISALTPAAEAAKPFTKSYKTLASAVDASRHELPVKNFHIAGDRREFLSKAEAYLQESEVLLREHTKSNYEENHVVLECLKGMKNASKELRQQLLGVSSELLELSSLISRHTVLTQQAAEEELLGPVRTLELFCQQK